MLRSLSRYVLVDEGSGLGGPSPKALGERGSSIADCKVPCEACIVTVDGDAESLLLARIVVCSVCFVGSPGKLLVVAEEPRRPSLRSVLESEYKALEALAREQYGGVESSLVTVSPGSLVDAVIKVREHLVKERVSVRRSLLALCARNAYVNAATLLACILVPRKGAVELANPLRLEDRLALPSLTLEDVVTKARAEVARALLEKPLSLRDLARRLRRDASTIARHVRHLMAKGIVKRRPDGTYALTDLGRVLAQK